MLRGCNALPGVVLDRPDPFKRAGSPPVCRTTLGVAQASATIVGYLSDPEASDQIVDTWIATHPNLHIDRPPGATLDDWYVRVWCYRHK